MKIGIIGLGFVGGAMFESFKNKNVLNLVGYDKYKDGGIGTFKSILDTDILFMALPTPYDSNTSEYDKSPIYETCKKLVDNKYSGIVVSKSTVEPGTIDYLSEEYPLCFVNNPEFLTARTAYEDFHNQKHIVLGACSSCTQDDLECVKNFYNRYYPDAEVSLCTALESESMKIFVNCFYATKVQLFTELYLTCKENGTDYNKVRSMMLKNGWINPMHTIIPGPDGQVSYGGLCFPKDTNALCKYMQQLDVPNDVIQSVINERNTMREDNNNIINTKCEYK